MFMEILYKQTTLFPLSSCRDRARVTFLLKGLNTPQCPDLHPERICYQPTHASRAHGYCSGSRSLPILGWAGIPSPWTSPQSRYLHSWFFPLLVVLFRWGKQGGKRRAYNFIFVPFHLPRVTRCLWSARHFSPLSDGEIAFWWQRQIIGQQTST